MSESEFERGWNAAIEAAVAYHEGEATDLIDVRDNTNKIAGPSMGLTEYGLHNLKFHQRSAVAIRTIQPDEAAMRGGV